MDEKNRDNKMNDYMIEKTIINMYKDGYSMNFIVKKYYNYKNKKQKPVKVDGVWCFPSKIYDMKYCRLYVYELIYKYLVKDYESSSIA